MANNNLEQERLVGSDGKLVTVNFSTELVGTTDSITEAGWYRVQSKAESDSELPTNSEVGDLVYLEEGSLADGDAVTTLDEREQADVTGFNIEISKAEIDVTTLSDSVRRYRTGKTDMNGSMEGITTLGETDQSGWVLNNFLRVIKQTGNEVEIRQIDESPVYLKGYIQKDEGGTQREAFVWARVNLLGASLGASGEDSQNFSSNFRIAPGDPDPTLYIRDLSEE